MKITRTLRRIVHDLYYKVSGKRGIEYALRCRDVAGHIDSKDLPHTGSDAIRFRLHLFLCQACRDYFHISQRLGQVLRAAIKSKAREIDLQELNKSLIQKYEPLEDRLKEKMARLDPPGN